MILLTTITVPSPPFPPELMETADPALFPRGSEDLNFSVRSYSAVSPRTDIPEDFAASTAVDEKIETSLIGVMA